MIGQGTPVEASSLLAPFSTFSCRAAGRLELRQLVFRDREPLTDCLEMFKIGFDELKSSQPRCASDRSVGRRQLLRDPAPVIENIRFHG